MRDTPHLVYQILTKWPELIEERLPPDWGDGYPNVWLGTSVENSRFAWRVDALRRIPAMIRFISAEPGSLFETGPRRRPIDLTGIDWVIVGGESGPGARPLQLLWARELAAACDRADVAFFMKQLGSVLGRVVGARDRKGGDRAAFPADLQRREFPQADRLGAIAATA